ncbi:MAG: pyruvate kinase [Planctomycetaceae bacterium]
MKTKIIATVGPASGSIAMLRQLVTAGVDLFRLNFAHGEHAWLAEVVASIRTISAEFGKPIGILGDLSGPKIRLGILPDEGFCCQQGGRFEFVREPDPDDPTKLTCTYEALIDDLRVGDRVLLADGIVALRVAEKPATNDRLVCICEQSGCIRSKQGVNVPGAALKVPSLTEKDLEDLTWAVENRLDYVGLSFVRSAGDIELLRNEIQARNPIVPPAIVAKIEKMEAVSDLETILEQTDAVMVARGDLGVEVDIAHVPALQKRIIRACNQHGVPVITATQMLDSMQTNELPTRAEASDVANAVLDGSDAVMLSGETAIGKHPVTAVSMMSRIVMEAERLVRPVAAAENRGGSRNRAKLATEAITLGAGTAAEFLDADLIVVATRSGKTAMALSNQRSTMPILALSDSPETTRRMCLYWGVTPVETDVVRQAPKAMLRFITDWGKRAQVVSPGSRVVLVGSTDWNSETKDLLLVHVVPG